jgi:hypothetical protein
VLVSVPDAAAMGLRAAAPVRRSRYDKAVAVAATGGAAEIRDGDGGSGTARTAMDARRVRRRAAKSPATLTCARGPGGASTIAICAAKYRPRSNEGGPRSERPRSSLSSSSEELPGKMSNRPEVPCPANAPTSNLLAEAGKGAAVRTWALVQYAAAPDDGAVAKEAAMTPVVKGLTGATASAPARDNAAGVAWAAKAPGCACGMRKRADRTRHCRLCAVRLHTFFAYGE